MRIARAQCQFWLCKYKDMDRFEIYLAGKIIKEMQRDLPRTIPKFQAYITGWLVVVLS